MAECARFAPINFKTRLLALDGIRALAVTMVFLFHYAAGSTARANGEGRLLGLIHVVDRRLGIGVDLFFVLSGFLITGILYDTRHDSRFFSRFYARRSLRIFPVFYLVALILLLLTPIYHYAWRPTNFTYLLYLGGYFSLPIVLSPSHPAAKLFIGHLWSLCVEEQFYLLWPLAVWLVRDRVRLLRLSIGLIILAFIFRCTGCIWFPTPHLFVNHGLPFRMDSLVIGAVLALLLRGPRADFWQRSCKWFFIGGTIGSIAVFSRSPVIPDDAPLTLTIGFLSTALASFGFIGMSLPSGTPLFRFFCLAPLRSVGKYSYGFYLLHMIWLAAWGQLTVVLTRYLHSYALTGLLVMFLTYAATYLAARLSYELFEKRFLRLKTRWEYDSEIAEHEHAFTTA